MNEEKYIIVDIHPGDAYYSQRGALLGKVITFPSGIKKNYEYGILGVPNGEGYTSGDARFDSPVELSKIEGFLPEKVDSTFFFAVKVLPIVDK